MPSVVEGALLGGVLLSEEEFVQVMLELLKERKQEIVTALENVQSAVNAKDAYDKWMIFQEEILKNPDVSLLTITNFYNKNGAQQSWTFLDSEKSAINKNGAINLSEVADELKQIYISQILTQHLSGLFRSIKDEMTYEEVVFAYELKKHTMLQSLNEAKYGNKLYIYKTIVYGKKEDMFLSGQVADAFVNHLGYTHSELFLNLSLLNTDYIEHLAEKSVKQEEFAISNLNFFRLLNNSTNTTGWYTGGDLILTDKTGKVIANIQLKTTASSGDTSFGNISTKKLLGGKRTKAKGIIQELLELIDQDNLILAKTFYQKLKTSGIFTDVEGAVEKTAVQIAEENLNLKLAPIKI